MGSVEQEWKQLPGLARSGGNRQNESWVDLLAWLRVWVQMIVPE